MENKLQRFDKDKFHIVFTKTISRKEFAKELEELYNKHYKPKYEQDGFRKGEVPFSLASLNGKLANSLLKTAALVDRQIFVEEIVKEVSDTGSIYDIVDGEDQTKFEAFDLSSEGPVILQLVVELASYVESVNYKEVKVDKDIIKTKPSSEKDLEMLYKEYKKVKEPQNKITKTSYIDLVFDDGKDEEHLTFNLSQKFSEEEEQSLKANTHREITELTMGKKVGDEFKYNLTGKDGSKLEVNVIIKDIYRIKTLSDEDFLEMLKDNKNIPIAERDVMDVDKVKSMFKDHLDATYRENYREEVRSLIFASLNSLTTGIHYNENEINNLKNQFIVQVQKVAEDEKVPYADYVKNNFGSAKLMEDYIDASQRTRVLQAAIYRKIGKDMGVQPTYTQLEGFVKYFLFKVSPNEKLDEGLSAQIDQQIVSVLSEPLNRQRIIES
jgi:hypothetical protein